MRRRPSAPSGFRRGSALLVVLGLLAFMVVSGIAFSSFTRYQRMPSSFLRRAVATRQLAKAALAEAIERVDTSIGDDPYPNRRPSSSTDKTVQSDPSDSSTAVTYGNYWKARVFIGEKSVFNALAGFTGQDLDGGDDNYKELSDAGCVTPGDTVTTFPFEGLAYIPPALVNDARFFGRRTPSAVWEPFTFDSGRYCFSCIDVSDCFDVNRMLADMPRASSAQRRISLAHVFEAGYDHYAAGSGTARWDKWLDDLRDVSATGAIEFPDDKVPLVSVADFNLAFYDKFGAGGVDGISSLFCNYVKDPKWNANGFFNCGSKVQASDAFEKRLNQMFVADGYYPLTPEEEQEIDDAGGFDLTVAQPFRSELMKNSEGQGLAPLLTFTPVPQGQRSTWKKYICGMGLAALFDYLDEDSEPVSLVMPTVERVPMVCAVQLKIDNLQIAIKHLRNPDASGKDGDDTPVSGTRQEIQNGYEIQMQHIDEYILDAGKFAGALTTARVYPVLTFPFLPDGTAEAKEDAQQDWVLDGRLEFFFSTDMSSGSSTTGQKSHVGTRVNAAEGYLHPKNEEEYASKGLLRNSVIALPLKKQTFAFKDLTKPVKPNAPYANFTVDSDSVGFSFNNSDAKAVREALEASNGRAGQLLRVTYRWKEQHVTDPQTGKARVIRPADLMSNGSYNDRYLYSASNMLRPIDCDGDIYALSSAKQDINDTRTDVAAAIRDIGNIALKAAVIIRVRSSSGEMADLVPASVYDDIALLGVPTSQRNADCTRCGGYGFPLLKFNLGVPMPFTPQTFDLMAKTAAQVATPYPHTYLCPDPRWNHAPEDWFAPNQNNITIPIKKNEWYDNCGCSDEDRDGDIFMATSDRGYLQSVYELAFLPRLTELSAANQGNQLWGDLGSDNPKNGKSGRFTKEWEPDVPDSIDQCKHSDRFWRTYRPYRQGDLDADDFDALGITCGTEGCRVNPYSDSTNVILAAFANTPFNWRLASTNNTIKPKPNYLTSWTTAKFNKKYAWNAFNDVSWRTFEWQDLQDFAASFMTEIDRVVANPPAPLAWGLNWRDALANQVWDYENRGSQNPGFGKFWGVDLPQDTVVTSVDRRYLYGFWHGSFAARQQLLLFFVRAEPMMMGGGVANTAPPQLSSRAVALVWRDPSKPNNANPGQVTNQKTGQQQAAYVPHRTRVLFYHQFE